MLRTGTKLVNFSRNSKIHRIVVFICKFPRSRFSRGLKIGLTFIKNTLQRTSDRNQSQQPHTLRFLILQTWTGRTGECALECHLLSPKPLTDSSSISLHSKYPRQSSPRAYGEMHTYLGYTCFSRTRL